ncbi:hypothetical protein ACRAWD_21235 [Caulobacter segnis]
MLRPMGGGATDALLTASFPLVPFCNRIPNGRFVFEGREVVLPPNLAGHPHALHGQGWRAGWTVDKAEGNEAVLSYAHAPDAWPWAYRAEQRFVLSETSFARRAERDQHRRGGDAGGPGLPPVFPAPRRRGPDGGQ